MHVASWSFDTHQLPHCAVEWIIHTVNKCDYFNKYFSSLRGSARKSDFTFEFTLIISANILRIYEFKMPK